MVSQLFKHLHIVPTHDTTGAALFNDAALSSFSHICASSCAANL